MMIKYSKELLEEAARESTSLAQMAERIGLAPIGGNYTTLKKKIQLFNIDISHFTGQSWNKGKSGIERTAIRPLEEVLQNGVKYPSSLLRKRLVNAGIKSCQCERCKGTHNILGEELSFELHHINGDHYDNRLENLQILCLDCHSKTDNYRGRNTKKSEDPVYIEKREVKSHYCICQNCGKEFYSDRTDRIRKFCSRECYNKYLQLNGDLNKSRPTSKGWTKEQLKELCDTCSTINEIAEKLGSYRSTVRDYLKRFDLYEYFKNK